MTLSTYDTFTVPPVVTITGIEFGHPEGYLVTECPVHGTTETADEASAKELREVEPDESIWACCNRVRVATPGERTFSINQEG
jgi:hypothetical protein